MHKVLCIDDGYSIFSQSFLDIMKENGIDCKWQNWSEATGEAKDTDGKIDFKRLSKNLRLDSYDLLLIDLMMPPNGILGTFNGFLTGINLHIELCEASPSIKALNNTFFITNLPRNEKPDSYYAIAEDYAKSVSGHLFRKNNLKDIVDKIIAELNKKRNEIEA